ncbi:CoA transferase [Phenylobacterium sp.]|uniref:CaiB/BaiF CoA-transferase family protein n=1 Tax=Phenylobacterium sp. TaxID=1871053 RepID=UPI0035B2F261
MTNQTASNASPLAGLRVVEAASDPGARYCGRLFSVLGARVVRVTGSSRPVAGAAAFEAWLDQGKDEAASLEAALEAVGAPDVVIAGQDRALIADVDAVIARRGLDTLRLGLTWFGETGPYADWQGDDALIHALTGIAGGFGSADGLPMMPQGRAPQITAGATLFSTGLAVLWGRRRGRADRRVDINVLEAAVAFTETSPPMFENSGVAAPRTGVNRFPANHPTTVYPTRDGWLGVTTLTPAQWSSLAVLVGRPEWAEDPRFSTSAARVLNADIVDAELSRVLPSRTTAEWLIAGQKARIPLAPVPSPAELIETDHWVERGAFEALPGVAGVKAPRLPFRMAFDGRPRPVPKRPGDAPLAGLRVVDFSMGWAGPLCTRQLADLGADIIKIESDTHYDWWRGWEPPGASDPPQYELSAVFNIMNRGKRGICLDLTTPQGAARALELVAEADMVIENYAPGVMAKLGLDAATLQATRPGLVMVSMGAFGATGPWSFFRAYGSTVEHASGMPHINGQADWPPCLQHGAYGDPVAGLYAAVAALACLHGRDRLGGAWVDLAQVECLFQLAADGIIAAQVDGPPPRLGNRNLHLAPRTVVRTADPEQALAIVVTTPAAWTALCDVLGRGDWAADATMATAAGRNARAQEIDEAIAAWALTRPAGAAAHVLQAAGVPAAPVVAAHHLPEEPHLAATGAWMRIDRRHVGAHLMASPPYHVDGARPKITRPAPLLGEHTAELLGASPSA